VGVDEVGTPGSASGRAAKRSQHQRHEGCPRRMLAQVADDTRPVGDSEVAKGRRRNDLDLDSSLADTLDGIRDEGARGVAREAWIRRGQDRDLQPATSA
jgi:hypothetical protein